jgi:hypothetical protein
MPDLIYIICDYAEHGAEGVHATTDKAKAPAMLDAFIAARWSKTTNMDKERGELAVALENGVGSFNLSDGWGGIVLEVCEDWAGGAS